ncbi:MAG: hypothetical protein COT55_00300 [Candidatus Diapherotrites archaeon CG09_land_8_20_14_0_10_32_12]|nr:MAG: hypothetical protein COT55_00300 [Candidatus Diapherotrites archaeon CG09_land_8_20_14_0_10_32_12]
MYRSKTRIPSFAFKKEYFSGEISKVLHRLLDSRVVLNELESDNAYDCPINSENDRGNKHKNNIKNNTLVNII